MFLSRGALGVDSVQRRFHCFIEKSVWWEKVIKRLGVNRSLTIRGYQERDEDPYHIFLCVLMRGPVASAMCICAGAHCLLLIYIVTLISNVCENLQIICGSYSHFEAKCIKDRLEPFKVFRLSFIYGLLNHSEGSRWISDSQTHRCSWLLGLVS